MKPDIVLIDWYDHFSLGAGSWQDADDLGERLNRKAVMIRSVGHLISENKELVCVAGHMSETGQVDGNIFIIKKNIFNRQTLRKGSK